MPLPRGIIVNQTDARRRGGHRAPLAVGVCRWRGTDDWLTVVAKLSLSIVNDEAVLVDPHPLNKEQTADHPTDFVPAKPRCDVIVVGHAHNKDASESISVALRVGKLSRRLNAIAGEPALSIPLNPDHLRDEQGEATSLSSHTIVREEEGNDFEQFDYNRFQVAQPSAQTEALDAGPTLDIRGLSPRGEKRSITLPKYAPRVWFERNSMLVRVEAACDTLFFDTDFERVDLVWRALIPPQNHRVQRLVVSLEDMSKENRSIEDVCRELPRGTYFWAEEEVDTERYDEELEMSSYEVLEYASEPEMTLEEYAKVSARVAEQDLPREKILDELELEERSWGIEERAWAEKIAGEAEKGDGTLAAEFAKLFLVAQDELKKPHEPKSKEKYVSVKAELERANKPNEVLEKHEICFGEWMRLERHWADEASKDRTVAEELNTLLTQARNDARAK